MKTVLIHQFAKEVLVNILFSKYPAVNHEEFSLPITNDKLPNVTLRQLQETFGINSYLIKCTQKIQPLVALSLSSSGPGNAFSMLMERRVPTTLMNKRKQRSFF